MRLSKALRLQDIPHFIALFKERSISAYVSQGLLFRLVVERPLSNFLPCAERGSATPAEVRPRKRVEA
jgi:hypothetical protein